MTTTTNREQADAFKSSTQAFMTLSEVAFSGFERLSALNLNMVRAALEDGMSASQSLARVKGVDELKDVQSPFTNQATEKVVTYLREVQQIATDLQQEITSVMTEQMSAFTKGGAGSNPFFDMFSKVAQQATDMTKTNLKKATETTEKLTQKATELTEANIKTATDNTDKMTAAVVASSKKSA